jgi:hypothetical protein
MLALTALAIAAHRLIDREEPQYATDVDRDALHDVLADALGGDDLPALASDRPDYRYSVIPRGAYDRVELRTAIQNDPVVAAHYEQLDQSRVRSERVTRDRFVHVSYRRGNQIFWTKNKVLLRQGETILTDGTTQIRARCGNCISEHPLLPTSNDEPDEVEFDRLTDPAPSPRTDPAPSPRASGPDVVFVPPAPALGGSAPAGAAGQAGQADAATPLAAGRFASGSLFPLALADPDSGGSGPETPPGNVPGPVNPPPGPGMDLPPIVGMPAPPPFGDPFVPGDELFPGTPTFPEPGYNPIGPLDEPLPPGSTNEPVPVPEPGTLLLVGGGVAALIRKLRSKTR